MKNGKLYLCNTTACIEHFNKNLELIPGKDYLELEKVRDVREVFEFLITPPPFCKYCNRAGVTFGHDWGYLRRIFLNGFDKFLVQRHSENIWPDFLHFLL